MSKDKIVPIQNQNRELLQKALRLPGVADLVRVYERYEQPYRVSRQYMENESLPLIFINSSASGRV